MNEENDDFGLRVYCRGSVLDAGMVAIDERKESDAGHGEEVRHKEGLEGLEEEKGSEEGRVQGFERR